MLERMGAPIDTMKERLTDNLQRTPRSAGPAIYPQAVAQVFITPRLKRVVDQATEEARLLQDEYVSTEHVLLGIVSERNGFSATLLREARITREMILGAIEKAAAVRRQSRRSREPLSHAGKVRPRSDRTGRARASSIPSSAATPRSCA